MMNRNGLTIAASNWNIEQSFIGINFSFRPYFKQAMANTTGRYFALGTTSQKCGYYFSHPVYNPRQTDGTIAGVIVVKIDLADIETAWSDRGNHFIVTNDDGIIFLSTNPDWTYQSILPIDAKRLDEIRLSRRYSSHIIRPFQMTKLESLETNFVQLRIDDGSSGKASNYLHYQQTMPSAGWTVHILSNVRQVRNTVFLRSTLASFALLILVLVISLYIVNRQRRLVLQQSTELLEIRVQKRTQDLQIEVEERRKAEQNLRDTQAELIQAAKLAGLGEMSAGISHELNQPLTAIRSFSENTQHMLDANQLPAALDNLVEIALLTEHMAGIIGQLRGFSRKSSGQRVHVSIQESIDQALGLFHREIKLKQIEVDAAINSDASVVTDPLLPNQVLVNIISNAFQAMSATELPKIIIALEQDSDDLVIKITDAGPGISAQARPQLFEPFFTSKEVGLGLGLSISHRIMQSLDGRTEVHNIIAGGACFELFLTNANPKMEC
jgi:two-component system C4-dicarboxylate transport sensor histidine kinase DctB